MPKATAFIPARGGSTRIKDKNLQRVGGKTLVRRAIDSARLAGLDVVVSTDSEEVKMEVGAALQVPFPNVGQGYTSIEIHERPAHLATATAQIEDAMLHWLRRSDLGPDDAIVLLHPTSPFRRPDTVRRCVDLLFKHDLDSVLTVRMDRQAATNTGRLRSIYDEKTGTDVALRVIWDRPAGARPRSQDVRPIPVEDGAVYVTRVSHLRATHNRMGGRESVIPVTWIESFEIDTPSELEVARRIAREPIYSLIEGAQND